MAAISPELEQPIVIALGMVALILSIGLHEFSHVLSASMQGDPTGRLMGRLSLNPIRHLDPWGTLFMFLTMLTGVGIGWGKPAPYNPNNLKYRRWGPFLVAIAGPISNILLVAIFGYILKFIFPNLPAGNLLVTFLQLMVLINAALAAFNLLPIPPLDGSRILSAVFGEHNPYVQFLERYGFVLLLLLIFAGRGVLALWVNGGINVILRILRLG